MLLFRSLVEARIIEFVPREDGPGKPASASTRISRRTSPSTTRSRSTCSRRSASSIRTAGTYPLDLLTLVESILENPELILQKQLDRLKTREARGAEGGGRRVRAADGGAREARLPEAEPRVHLRHLQRLRAPAPLGGAGEHPPEGAWRARCTSSTCRSASTSGNTTWSARRAAPPVRLRGVQGARPRRCPSTRRTATPST